MDQNNPRGGSRPRLPVDQSRTRAGQPSPLQMPSPSVRPRAVRPETQGETLQRPPITSSRGPPGQPPVQMMAPSARPRATVSPATPGQTRQPLPAGISPGQGVRQRPHSPALDVTEQMASLDISTRASMQRSSGTGSSGDGQKQATAAIKSSLDFYSHTRPADLVSKKGEGGVAVQLKANYFHVKKLPKWTLFQYRVDFDIEEDRTHVRRKIVYLLKEKLGPFVFEGTMMFTTRRLLSPNQTEVVHTVDFENQKVSVKIFAVGEVRDDMQLNHFLNNLMKKCVRTMGLVQINRDLFDQKGCHILDQEKIEIWPGYRTSLRRHEDLPLVCCDLINKIVRLDNACTELKDLMRNYRNNKSDVSKEVIGRTVMTIYNNKMYRVDDILWDERASAVFKDAKGTEMSIAAYMINKYGKKIVDLQQPLFLSNPTSRMKKMGIEHPVKLVPELCKFTGLTDKEKANFRLMATVAKYTRSEPPKRVQMLRQFGKSLLEKKEVVEVMKEWDLAFDSDLVNVSGRVLSPENIFVRAPRPIQYLSSNADWNGAFNQPLSAPAGIQTLAVIAPLSEKELVEEFLSCIGTCGQKMGIIITNLKRIPISDTRTSTYVNEIRRIIEMRPSMIMAMVPNNKGDAYDQIKKITYIERPMPCQVMTLEVLRRSKNMASVAKKVIAQMSAKLGGELWRVDVPVKSLMVVGFDTWHDTSAGRTSVGALVCSINEKLTQYVSYSVRHPSSDELGSQIVVQLAAALGKYHEKNGKLPDRIVFYRDGVGEGQIEQLRKLELGAITKMLNSQPTKIKLTFIIVSKRINTRFFLVSSNEPSNPMSGTVVDDVVTLPERYDFFLVSQSVRIGTVNPTSYNVIFDQSGWPPKHIQALSYKLTHLYYNWPGTVRVPAVCQYAHKLAYMVGESLHANPHKDMCSSLFYL